MKISRSGYYDFLQRRKSKSAIENEALTEAVEDIFQKNNGRYGARRIQIVLSNMASKSTRKEYQN